MSAPQGGAERQVRGAQPGGGGGGGARRPGQERGPGAAGRPQNRGLLRLGPLQRCARQVRGKNCVPLGNAAGVDITVPFSLQWFQRAEPLCARTTDSVRCLVDAAPLVSGSALIETLFFWKFRKLTNLLFKYSQLEKKQTLNHNNFIS